MNPVGTADADVSWLSGIPFITWFNMGLGAASVLLLGWIAVAAYGLHRAGKAHKASAQADSKEQMGWAVIALVVILSFGAVTNIIYAAVN